MTTTTAIVPTALATELSYHVERRLKELQSSVESYQRYIEGKRTEMAGLEAAFIETFGLKARLEAAGFKPHYDQWNECLRLTIDQKQLTAVYKVVGRVNGGKVEKNIEDSKKRLVRVYLTPVNHPNVRIDYVTKLPKRGAKCKIVTVRHKARVEKQLVCTV